MGEILRDRLAKRAKFIAPKYFFSGYTDFTDTMITTKPLNPIIVRDGHHFLMMGFVVTYVYALGQEVVNTQDNADFTVALVAGRSSFEYQFAPRQFMLENHSVNAATDFEHYIMLSPLEQINLEVTNRFVPNMGEDISIGFTAYGEEYRF